MCAEDPLAYTLGTFMDPAGHLGSQGLARDEAGNNGFFVGFEAEIASWGVDFRILHNLIFQGQGRLSMVNEKRNKPCGDDDPKSREGISRRGRPPRVRGRPVGEDGCALPVGKTPARAGTTRPSLSCMRGP